MWRDLFRQIGMLSVS
jgi:hypothetical protein